MCSSFGFFLEFISFFHRKVFVGDVVVLKDPVKSNNFLVRRLAAIEGYEMASTDEKDEPFVLEEDQCWVVADNESIKPKVYTLLEIFILHYLPLRIQFSLFGLT